MSNPIIEALHRLKADYRAEDEQAAIKAAIMLVEKHMNINTIYGILGMLLEAESKKPNSNIADYTLSMEIVERSEPS